MPSDVLHARDVEVVLPGGRRILGPVSLEVTPGTFTAILGPSGSGKTTLLRAMAGVTVPTGGAITLGDEPATLHVDDLGYVAQRETVHDRLTVHEALAYAATLRLESGRDVEPVIRQVLEELDLAGQAGTLIRDLSGGERRRAACGLELVGRPRVLLLDEPTSGLDPVLERRLMLMFRRLADQGLAIVLVTHATASLELCDLVTVLAPGGRMAVSGAPAAALAHLDGVARAAETDPADAPAADARHGSGAFAGARPFHQELRLLVERYARTVLRDRRTLAALLVQAPVIGLLIALLFRPHALTANGANPADAAQLVFLLMTGAVWLGVTSACREVVKEREIVEREFDIGLRLDGYVLAKALVLFALSAVQVLLMSVIVVVLQPLGVSIGDVLALIGLAIGVAWVSVAMGLLVSTLARSVDQAASIVPLILMPQLLFAGALVPLARMAPIVRAFSELTYGRWAYAGMGSALGLQGRLDGSPDAAGALGFGDGFFTISPGVVVLVLAGFAIVLLLLATLMLNRRALPDG